MMTRELIARLIQGAFRGSLVLTTTESTIFLEEVNPKTVVVVDGNPVVLRDLPMTILPDHPAMLP